MSGANFGAFADGLLGGVKAVKAYKDANPAKDKPESPNMSNEGVADAVRQGANQTLAVTPNAAQLPSAEAMGFGQAPETGGAWGTLKGMLSKGPLAGGTAAGANPLGGGIGGTMKGERV